MLITTCLEKTIK